MLSEKEKKDLISELNICKNNISKLKEELDAANNEKERLFSIKEEFSKEIVALISNIKKFRSLRDTLTKDVQDSKKRRTELNQKINQLITEIKELQNKRKENEQSTGMPKNPGQLKKEIETLEFKIETQPMNFNEEQKLMKKIKTLKKQLSECSGVLELNEKIRGLSKQIDELKAEADNIHKELQEKAVESQKKHEEMIDFSKKVDELKKKEQDAYKEFFTKKENFSELNKKLKEELAKFAEISQKLDKNKIEVKKDKKRRQAEMLEEKQMSVQEKIDKGKKLTTEDLLAFQKVEVNKK